MKRANFTKEGNDHCVTQHFPVVVGGTVNRSSLTLGKDNALRSSPAQVGIESVSETRCESCVSKVRGGSDPDETAGSTTKASSRREDIRHEIACIAESIDA